MRITSTLLLLIFTFFSLYAQEKEDPKTQQKFVGTWQLCEVKASNLIFDKTTEKFVIDTTTLKLCDTYKTFSPKGDFTVLVINPIMSLVTITGTYEVMPDKYIENVDFHAHSDYAHRKNELSYEFLSENFFFLTYTNTIGKPASEVWKRVPKSTRNTEINKLFREGKFKFE